MVPLPAYPSKPRKWRRPLSSAVHAYRQLLKMREDLTTQALENTSIEALANICPRCFGPGERSKFEAEPDSIVCMDANFQQRRHVAASWESEEMPLKMPSQFLTEEYVQVWANKAAARGSVDESLVSIDAIEVEDFVSAVLTVYVLFGRTLAHSSTRLLQTNEPVQPGERAMKLG